MTDQTAQTDQDQAEATSQAKIVASFFNELIANNLQRDEALQLASEYQAERFEDARPRDGE